ncbi:hypothetical protein D3C86_1799890 [compost metagenome]
MVDPAGNAKPLGECMVSSGTTRANIPGVAFSGGKTHGVFAGSRVISGFSFHSAAMCHGTTGTLSAFSVGFRTAPGFVASSISASTVVPSAFATA